MFLMHSIHMTPYSPWSDMCASRDKHGTSDMDEGVFLSETGSLRETTLHLRLEALQQPIGGGTAFPTQRRGTITDQPSLLSWKTFILH